MRVRVRVRVRVGLGRQDPPGASRISQPRPSLSLSLSLSTVNQDRDLRNNVLIKAVQLYLDEKKIEYRNANLQLMRCATQGSHPGLAALR